MKERIVGVTAHSVRNAVAAARRELGVFREDTPVILQCKQDEDPDYRIHLKGNIVVEAHIIPHAISTVEYIV